MDNRVLKVKGVGKSYASPDRIKINIDLRSSDLSYEKALELSNKDLEGIRKSLKEEGFEKKDIKTNAFNVDTKYENETTGFNSKRKFAGYEIVHSLNIEFDNDGEKLSKVLNALARSKSNPEFSILYKLKDATEFKEEVLKDAISDSKRKALLIAQASGVKLGEVLSINYNSDEGELFNSPLSLQRNMSLMSESLSIVAEDLELTDWVDITWKIED